MGSFFLYCSQNTPNERLCQDAEDDCRRKEKSSDIAWGAPHARTLSTSDSGQQLRHIPWCNYSKNSRNRWRWSWQKTCSCIKSQKLYKHTHTQKQEAPWSVSVTPEKTTTVQTQLLRRCFENRTEQKREGKRNGTKQLCDSVLNRQVSSFFFFYNSEYYTLDLFPSFIYSLR